MNAKQIVRLIERARIDVSNEDKAHTGLAALFESESLPHEHEVILSPGDRIDFMIGAIGIEVKVAGSKRNIFRQVERYCQHDRVHEMILVTSRATGLPQEINGKPVHIASLGRGWL